MHEASIETNTGGVLAAGAGSLGVDRVAPPLVPADADMTESRAVPPRVFSARLCRVSDELISALVEARGDRQVDSTEKELNAFLLDPGLGPPA
jgi:hypothetical protein